MPTVNAKEQLAVQNRPQAHAARPERHLLSSAPASAAPMQPSHPSCSPVLSLCRRRQPAPIHPWGSNSAGRTVPCLFPPPSCRHAWGTLATPGDPAKCRPAPPPRAPLTELQSWLPDTASTSIVTSTWQAEGRQQRRAACLRRPHGLSRPENSQLRLGGGLTLDGGWPCSSQQALRGPGLKTFWSQPLPM